MFSETNAYDGYFFWVSALPVIASLVLYIYIRVKLYDTAKGVLLYFLCIALFFVSVFLFADGKDIYPIVKVWVVEKDGKGLVKNEKSLLNNTTFRFADNSSVTIKPGERNPGEWYLLVNNTDITLYVEKVRYGSSDAFYISDESSDRKAVPPYSTGYFNGLDFFGKGSESVPDIIKVYVSNSGSGSLSSSNRYWVRW